MESCEGCHHIPKLPQGVIATALYQELCLDKSGLTSRFEQSAQDVQYDEDGWVIDVTATKSREVEKRKLLVFSDSRQDAAYFAPYMQTSYDRMLRRNILLETAREAIDELPDLKVMVSDLWKHAELKLRPVLPTGYDARIEAQKWVLHEFTGRDKHGLSGLDCSALTWSILSDGQCLCTSEGMGLSEAGSMGPLPGVARHLRTSGAVSVPRGGSTG